MTSFFIDRLIYYNIYKTIHMRDSVKEWIQYILCLVCVAGAMIMSFLAMYIDPTGEIHDSILWLIAQVLVFSGSLMGINSLHQVQLKRIKEACSPTIEEKDKEADEKCAQ